MKKRLTDKTVTHLEAPPAGRVDVFDSLLPGFGVRVTAKGRKTFFCFFRLNGRQSRLLLGDYDEREGHGVKLAEARKAARAAMTAASEGDDPRQAPSETIPDGARESFEDVVDDFLKYHCKAKLKPRTAAAYERELKRIKARIGSKSIAKVTRRQVLDITEGYLNDGHAAQAAQTHRLLASLFNWCVQRGILAASPMTGLRVPARVPARDRVLSDRELAAIWEAAGTVGYPFGTFVRLLAATGQRAGEVARIRRQDVDGALWTLSETKSTNPHKIVLPDLARAELESVPTFNGDYLLSGRAGKTPISGFSKAKTYMDVALLRMHKEAPDKWPEVAPWRFHDLRRTAASGMARLGVPPHVIEATLNHRSGVVSGIARVYNVHSYGIESAEALTHWCRHLETITGTAPAANVVELRR